MWNFLEDLRRAIPAIFRMERKMSDIANQLNGVRDQLSKASGEILAKIADLETRLANAGKLDEADVAALDALKATAQALDDIVPDAPAEPTEPEPA